jgi:hypothetical protein
LSPYQETTAHGPNFSRPPPELIDGEEEYQVERILEHRYHGHAKVLQYLIKWANYPEADNTWETTQYRSRIGLNQGLSSKKPSSSYKSHV